MFTPGLDYDDQMHHEEALNNISPMTTRPMPGEVRRVRRMSRSENNLNIPHLMLSQDEQHPSLHRLVSGLFQVDSALKTPQMSHAHLDDIVPKERKDEKSWTSRFGGFGGFGGGEAAPLRKSSSAVDWSHLTAGAQANNQSEFHSAIEEFNARNRSFNNLTSLDSTAQSSSGMSGMVAERKPSTNMSSQLSTSFQVGGGSSQSHTQSNPLHTQPNVPSTQSHGVLGMFNRGFFSKPVVRSDEENYRYLMALDR